MSLEGLLFWGEAIPLLLLILVPLVLIHELGHFVVARLTHIRVLEFGLGFPPRAKVIGHDHETEYTLNWLPIGGFVRLEGEEENSDDPRAFTNAPLRKQLVVLVAGVGMNVVTAMLLLFVVAWAFNPIVAPTITLTNDPNDMNTPARMVGLHDGDTLISIDGQPFTTQSVLDFSNTDPTDGWRQQLKSHQGQWVVLVVADTNGTQRAVDVQLRVQDSAHPALGVSVGSVVTSTGNPGQAVGQAVNGTGKAMSLILVALGNIGHQIATNPGSGPQGVQGPVGIASDVGHLASGPNAIMLLLLMMAVISANLALVNVLPFPPLDGGKIVIMVLKRVFRAKGVGRVETFAYLAGFAFLIAFIGWITFFDVVRGGAP
jgi:regulator of sigma E protease